MLKVRGTARKFKESCLEAAVDFFYALCRVVLSKKRGVSLFL